MANLLNHITALSFSLHTHNMEAGTMQAFHFSYNHWQGDIQNLHIHVITHKLNTWALT
jgi:hypothetical protein